MLKKSFFKIKELWNRFRWWIILLSFLTLLFILLVRNKENGYLDLMKWFLTKKIEASKRQLDNLTRIENDNDDKIEQVRKEIDTLENLYDEIEERNENIGYSDLARAFDSLGY